MSNGMATDTTDIAEHDPSWSRKIIGRGGQWLLRHNRSRIISNVGNIHEHKRCVSVRKFVRNYQSTHKMTATFRSITYLVIYKKFATLK